MYRTDFWTLWEKARVRCSERIALKQVYYQGWNRSPAQVGCMRQVLRAGARGRPRGMGWRERQDGGSGWGTHVNPWLIHVNVWQKPLQYCKVISLQLIKINGGKKKKVERQRIDAFELWSWRRLRRVPRTARRSNQSILKGINPKYSLEGLTLKLKLQYFGHWMWRGNTLGKTPRLRKIEGRRRRQQRMASSIQQTWIWANSRRWWRTGKPDVL